MTIAQQVTTIARNARQASFALAKLSTSVKNRMLLQMADALEAATTALVAENARDLAAGREKGLSRAMLDRLMLARPLAMRFPIIFPTPGKRFTA